MPAAVARLPTLIIPNGTNVSNIWRSREVFEDCLVLAVGGISVTDGALTYTWEASDDPEVAAGGTWFTVQAPADLAPPAQGKWLYYSIGQITPLFAAGALRIKASGNVTAQRSWAGSKQFDE